MKTKELNVLIAEELAQVTGGIGDGKGSGGQIVISRGYVTANGGIKTADRSTRGRFQYRLVSKNWAGNSLVFCYKSEFLKELRSCIIKHCVKLDCQKKY